MAAYLIFALSYTPPVFSGAPICKSLAIIISDSDERQYVGEEELTKLLQLHGLYPVGRTIESISTDAIEHLIRSHDMVRTAESYLTTNHGVRIRLTQRVPIVRVVTAGESYFVDTDRKIMPIRASVTNPIMTATGNIGHRMAQEELCDFVLWLQTDRYWRERIASIEVRNPKLIILHQHKGQACIVLGELAQASNKLRKLRQWYKKAPEGIDISVYKELDIRYNHQVVGRK